MQRAFLAAFALTSTAAVLPALGQEVGGSTLSATISQRFEADTNYDLEPDSPGTTYFAQTGLNLGFLTETPTQTFRLGLDTGLRALDKAGEDFEWTIAQPSTALLGYSQDWSNAAVTTDFRYRQNRVDFDRPLDDFLNDDGVIVLPDDLSQLTGDTTERRYDANLGLALATDAPSSYGFNLRGTRFDYSEEDANQTPRTTVEGDATWTLQLTPLLSSTLRASHYRYDADNVQETEIRESEIDAGVIYEPSQVLRLTGGFGYAERTRKQFGVTDEDDSGPTARAGLRYTTDDFVVNGELRVSAAAPDTRVSGNLRIGYPLPWGNLNARVFQRYSGGSTGEENRATGGGIGLLRNLDSVSRIRADFAVARQVEEGEDDITRYDATATYTRALTDRVSADIGYRLRYRDEGPDDATSHAVFFQIGRTFDTGF